MQEITAKMNDTLSKIELEDDSKMNNSAAEIEIIAEKRTHIRKKFWNCDLWFFNPNMSNLFGITQKMQ